MSLTALLVFILILGTIVLVHEFGHFIWAKKFGVHIYEFAIGMGPKVFSWVGKKDKIRYSIRLLPIGGFVQMAGEVYEDDEKIDKSKFMCNRPWYQRMIIITAGVINNFILAIVIFFIYGLIWGSPSNLPLISEVSEGSAMMNAGVKENDLIVEINDKKVKTWDKAQILLSLKSKGNVYKIKVMHEDETYDTYKVKPTKVVDEETKEESYVFGITINQSEERGFISSLKYAFTKFISVIETMWITITSLITGNLALNNLSGPVGVYQVVNMGLGMGVSYILYLTAFLSVNVGFINILPFPAFDGGRALFMLIEKIIRRPINSKIENTIHGIGFILLLILMVVITWNDIVRIFF